MNNCPKCGSYIPDGKLFCPACGRVKFGASKTARDRVHAERARTMERIQDAQQMVKRDAWLSPKENNPYRGGTYEQHKSHDPNSEDYYKSKYEKSASNQSEQTQNLICAAAYFGVFFFLPLVTFGYLWLLFHFWPVPYWPCSPHCLKAELIRISWRSWGRAALLHSYRLCSSTKECRRQRAYQLTGMISLDA